MSTLRQAAEQALAAIIELEYSSSTAVGDRMAREAKQALRQALAAEAVTDGHQLQDEPVAEVIVSHVMPGLNGMCTAEVESRERLSVGAELFIHPQPAQQPLTQQRIQELADEGVFHGNIFEIVRRIEEEHGTFKTRPLTDEQIDVLALDADGLPNSHLEFARAIERAHGITGEAK